MSREEWDDDNKPRRGVKEQDNKISYSDMPGRISSPVYQAALSSSRSECLLKVTSFGRGAEVKKLMEYIGRVGKDAEMQVIDNHGLHHKGKEAVQEIYDQWKGDFERKRKGSTRTPRHATHIILSAKTDGSKQDERKVAFAAQDFVDKVFNQAGFEYVYALHNDTEHPHVHIVVKNYNQITKKKLSLSKSVTFDMRQSWAKALTQNGLEAVATLRRDRPQVLDDMMQNKSDIKNDKSWLDIQMEKASVTGDVTLGQRKVMMNKVRSLKDEIKLHGAIDKEDKLRFTKKLKRLKKAIVLSDKKVIQQEIRRVRGDFSAFINVDKFFKRDFEQERRQVKRVVAAKGFTRHYIETLLKESDKVLQQLEDKGVRGFKFKVLKEGLVQQFNAASNLVKKMNKPSRLKAFAKKQKAQSRMRDFSR